MTTDPALLDAAREQLDIVIAAQDRAAYLGWWRAWTAEPGVYWDDLVDLTRAAGLPWWTEDA